MNENKKIIIDYLSGTFPFDLIGDEKGERITFNINLCDLHINNQNLYDSTFLSYAYAEKKNKEFKELESFTRLTPTIEELNKCNSKFYNKINN